MATILIVDDRPTDRLYLATLLGYAGHRLIEAADGALALALALAERPDLVITDVLMPGLDGFEFVRRLLADPEAARTPVIFYTASYGEQESRRLAETCGVFHILTKPSEPEVILRTVDAALGRPEAPLPIPGEEFEREHLRLVSEKLYQKSTDLEAARRLAALVRVWQQLAEQPDPHRLLEHCCRVARETVGSAFAAIGILDDRGSRLHDFVPCGPGAGASAPSPPDPRAGVLGALLADRRPRRLSGPELAGLPPHEPAASSFLGVTIGSPRRTIGWLYFLDKSGAEAFGAEDEELAVILASQVGLAFENASRYDEIRRRKAALEEADERKDRFLAVLSHELRTPLTPVLATISYVEGLPDLPAILREEIASIRRNVELEARLIDDLLDVTRIGRGKLDLESEVLDAHATLRAALEVCQADVEDKNLEISMTFRAKAYYVRADPARIRQVFWNLIKNAIKFTPEGGRIGLRTANTDGGRIAIQVADTGEGIEPGLLPRIFNAFEQGERTVTRRFGGLCLGLTIARTLVDLHGGTLTAESGGRGRGATFTVELDTVAAPADPPRAPDRASGASGTIVRILLVEDNPDTLRALTKLLHASGFVVESAASVREAFKAAAGDRFDLVVSDIGLPDGSGLDIMRHVRSRYGLKGIAFSGYGTDDDVRASKEAGFEHHLTKPVSLGVLVDLILRMRP